MMDWFVAAFVRASLAWLAVGVAIGLAMAFVPGEAMIYLPAHVHANLLGFVSMMIFGVAYHVLPRFSGRPLHSRALAGVHFWAANAGLLAMVSGWLLRGSGIEAGVSVLHTGAPLSAVGALLFVYNLWRTLGPVGLPGRLPQPLPNRGIR